MTRSQIEQAVYRRTSKRTDVPNGATQTRIREFVDTRLRTLLTQHGLSKLRDVTLDLTTVASQAQYGLATAFSTLYRVVDPTNRTVLEERGPEWYRQIDPSPTEGTPWVWVNLGYQATALQPSDASAVYVTSDSASDTGTCYVEGVTDQGTVRSVSVTMTGTTAVAVGSVSDFVRITKFYLSLAAVGDVTLLEDSGTGTELARIPVGETDARLFTLALWPTPAAAITLRVDGQRSLTGMVQDTDSPPLPEDFHAMLVDGACADECLHLDDSRTTYYEQLWQSRVRDLYGYVHGRISLGGGSWDQGAPRSRLGAWYPAGT